MTDQRSKDAKAQQGHDADPPRCMTCVYFRREPHTLYTDRQTSGRSGKVRTIRVKLRPHPLKNPLVDRCSFGNFLVKGHHLCDEWHSHDGSKLESDE